MKNTSTPNHLLKLKLMINHGKENLKEVYTNELFKKNNYFFLIGISVNCEEITRINNNVRDDKNWLSMEIEKDEKIKILKNENKKLSLCLKKYNLSNFFGFKLLPFDR